MHRSERSRGVSFTALLIMLLVLCTFTIIARLQHLTDPERALQAVIDLGFSVVFIICGIAVLKWKQWGMFGLIGFGALACITYLSQNAVVQLITPLIALMVVLISVLTKEWFGME